MALDAGMAPAHFNLARALASSGAFAGALRAIREGQKYDSANDARTMADVLKERLQGKP